VGVKKDTSFGVAKRTRTNSPSLSDMGARKDLQQYVKIVSWRRENYPIPERLQ